MDDVTEASGEHPTAAQLASFAWGGTAVGPDLSEHLARCERCAAIVARSTAEGPTAHAVITRSSDVVPAQTHELEAGAMIGRYRIVAQIGQGGMGVVYRAVDTELDREVALKLVRAPTSSALDELAERLRRESRLQARAKHPSVITVHDIGHDGDRVYVAMELAAGGTLRAWLEKPRTWQQIVDVFLRAGEGLAAAHAAGLVHRDFKPDNVLVEERDGRVVRVLVTDFGVARAVEAAERETATSVDMELTSTGALVGTPAYMAPEQLRGDPVDARTDIFAYGVGLWEALHGARPFPGKSIGELVMLLEQPPVAPGRASFPRWLDRMLRRMLAIAPADRYPTMTAVLSEIEKRTSRFVRGAVILVTGVLLAGAALVMMFVDAMRPVEHASLACEHEPGANALLAARDRLATMPSSPGRDRWIAALAAYQTKVGELRGQACAGERPANWVDRAECLDLATAQVAARVDAVVRDADARHALATFPPVPPYECATEAAGNVRRWLMPDAPRTDEAAFATALAKLDSADGPERMREVAVAAERSEQFLVAANSWLLLASAKVDLDGKHAFDLLAHTDGAIRRAGDPPVLRARWHALYAYTAAVASDEAKTDRAIADAERTLAGAKLGFHPEVEGQLGRAELRLGRVDRALARHEKAFRYYEVAGARHLEAAQARMQYIVSLNSAQRGEGVIALLAPVVATLDPDAITSHDAVAIVQLAFAYTTLGRYAEAVVICERWLAPIDHRVAARSAQRILLRMHLATSLFMLKRTAAAERVSVEALELYIETKGIDHYDTADARVLHGQILVDLGRVEDGHREIERGYKDLVAQAGEADPLALQSRIALADVLLRLKKPAEAVPHYAGAFAGWRAIAPPIEVALAELQYAKALVAIKDHTRARALLETAIPVLATSPLYGKQLAEARQLAR